MFMDALQVYKALEAVMESLVIINLAKMEVRSPSEAEKRGIRLGPKNREMHDLLRLWACWCRIFLHLISCYRPSLHE